MDFILMMVILFILYCIFTFCVIKGCLKRDKQYDKMKGSFGRYFFSVIIFLISFALLSAVSFMLAWIIDDGLDLKMNSECILISLVYVIIQLTLGIVPVKAIYRLLYRRPLRIFAAEVFTEKVKTLSWQGRIGRARYFGALMMIYIGIPVLWCLLMYILIELPLTDSLKEIIPTVTIFITAVIMIALNIIVVVKRIHDLDQPRKHVWLLLIPLYNIYYGLLLLYQKGSFGDNRFGPDPVNPISNINELCNSFPGIDINKYQYIVAYSYESREKAEEEYKKLQSLLIDYEEKINIQLREYTNKAEFEDQIVFFAENPLKIDALIMWLGNENYEKGRKLISSGIQKEYFDLEGYRELFGKSKTIED